MDNDIQFIDQRIAHLSLLIPQCRALSVAAEKRLPDMIITLEIKRIETIHAFEKRLGELRALLPIYKARCPTYNHLLVKQIINLDLQLIAAKTKHFPSHPPAEYPLALHPAAPHIPATNLPTPQPIQLNDMAGILSERPRQVQKLYWQPGQPISFPVRNF